MAYCLNMTTARVIVALAGRLRAPLVDSVTDSCWMHPLAKLQSIQTSSKTLTWSITMVTTSFRFKEALEYKVMAL